MADKTTEDMAVNSPADYQRLEEKDIDMISQSFPPSSSRGSWWKRNSESGLKIISHRPNLDPIANPGELYDPAVSALNDPFTDLPGRSPPSTPVWRLFKSGKAVDALSPISSAHNSPGSKAAAGFCGRLGEFCRPGSIRGSTFNLCSATLGAGALSVPFTFQAAGFGFGLCLLVLGGMATVFSIYLLILARQVTQKPSYEDLSVFLFGKGMGVIVEVNIIVFCFGAAVSYVVAVGDILESLIEIKSVAGDPVFPGWCNRTTLMVIFWAFVMFPLSLVEKVNSLTWTSLLGVMAIFYLVIATTIHSALENDTWQPIDNSISINLITALPTVMFAYTCQVNVFSIQTELERPSAHRMKRVTRNATFICFVVYAAMGIFGYLNFHGNALEGIEGNILKNYPIQNIHTDPKEWIILFAFLAITTTVVLAFPLNIFPCRFTIEFMIWGKDHQNSFLMRFLLTLVICGAALGVAIAVPSIRVVFQLLGGTSSAFVCYVLPAAFMIKLGDKLGAQSCLFWFGVWALFIGGIAAGIGSTTITVMNWINPTNNTGA